MVFGYTNSDLCYDDKKIKKIKIFNDKKIRSVFIVKKEWKKIFLRREFHSEYEFMQSWIKTNTNIVVHDLFLLFKNLHGTLIWEKFRYASHKDADLFLFEKNSDLHLRKMQIYFCTKKNSDLHLEKM